MFGRIVGFVIFILLAALLVLSAKDDKPEASKKVAATQINCIVPDHVYVAGKVDMWCEGNGKISDLRQQVSAFGDSHAQPSTAFTSPIGIDGKKCKKDRTCFSVNIIGIKPSDMTVLAVELQADKASHRLEAPITVLKDEW